MEWVAKFQLHIFTILVLLIIYFIMKKRSSIDSVGKYILRVTVFFTLIGVIMEPISWIFDRKTFFGARFIEYTSNYLIILIAPLIAALMMSYVRYKINQSYHSLYKQVILFPATIFTVVMLIINVFYPIYFDIDYVNNAYTVGDFLWIHYLVIASVYVYFLIYMFLHKQKVTKTVFFTYITFFFLPVLGIIVQLLESNIFFAWNSIALGIFVAYTFFETTSGEIDYLTKLYNRKGYELYVKHLMETNKDFRLVYFDLNRFKAINDEHGHAKGDQVLIMFSESLKNVFVNSNMISRLGGDEFMVVEEGNNNINEEINNIKNDILASKDDVYRNVEFSYGSEVYFDDLSIDELYQMVDAKMYNNKRGSSSV